MARISNDIPTAQEAKVFDAFALVYGFDPDAGITKAAFTKKIIASFIKDTVKAAQRMEIQQKLDNLVPDDVTVT